MPDSASEVAVPQLPPPVTQAAPTHSKVGIASCVLGVGMFLAFLVGILYFNISFDSDARERWFSSDGMFALQLFVVVFLPIPVHVVGFVLGSVSLFFPTRKKLFPLLGMILNLLFGICSLFPWLWLFWLALRSGGVK